MSFKGSRGCPPGVTILLIGAPIKAWWDAPIKAWWDASIKAWWDAPIKAWSDAFLETFWPLVAAASSLGRMFRVAG